MTDPKSDVPTPEFIYKGKPVIVVETTPSGTLTKIYNPEYQTEDDAVWVRTELLKKRPVKKRPGYLSIDDLTWDAEGRLAWFIGHLANHCVLNLESPLRLQTLVENMYFDLTSEVLLEEKALYNVTLSNKFGPEAYIIFHVTDELPDAIGCLQVQRAGFINRIEFFWSLIRLGFRLTKEAQDSVAIRQAVPENQRHYFDAGFSGKTFKP